MSQKAVKDEGNTALMEDAKNTSLGTVETDMEKMAVSASASKTVSKAATRSADVTGELMPFVLGQLQASLESLGASGGGSLLRRDSCPAVAGSRTSSSPSRSAPPPSSVPPPSLNSTRTQSPAKSELPDESHPNTTNQSSAPTEECLFDSGTESGEDGGGHDPLLLPSKGPPPPAEFSSFMEGLRDTLSREGSSLQTVAIGDKSTTSAAAPESDLIQQVEKVLTLLRDTLVKDPQSQNLKEGPMTPDLIALIDRLKESLKKPEPESVPAPPPSLPFIVGSPSPPKESHAPDVGGATKLPWAAASAEAGSEGPWRYRAAKKRGLIRSRSIGLSDEEIQEARRHMQEEAFRSALSDDTKLVKDNWDRISRHKSNGDDKITRRLSSYDDSTFQNHFKPTRAFSLGNEIEAVSDVDDPSRSFFTPAEVVQIAIHKAAIQKQVTYEEDRRRNSLSSSTSADSSVPKQVVATSGVKRDFTLALPKPYVAPSSDDAGAGPRRPSGQLMLSKPAQRSIENVQISLNESGDLPQLQIAITLNTNTSTGQDQVRGGVTMRGESEEKRGQGEGSSDESSKSSYRHRPKSDRKKKLKRANTIDAPTSAVDTDFGDDVDEEGQRSEDEPLETQQAPVVPTTATTPFTGMKKGLFLFDKKEALPKPAFLTANDNYWNNRFSTLKTSFESSSQGSSPSLSPVPPPNPRGHHPAHAHVHPHAQLQFSVAKEPSSQPSTKPVWASTSPGQRSPSSVKHKLSVFENKVQVPVPSGLPKPDEIWQLPNVSPQSNRNSGIFKTRESIERKLSAQEPSTLAMSLPSRASIARDYDPEGLESPSILPPTINEGVHTVHATKSALEAMQRQNQPSIPTSQFQPQPHPHALFDREATPPWQKISQPMAQFLTKFNQFKSAAPPPPVPPKSNIGPKTFEFEQPNQGVSGQAQRQGSSLVKQRTSAFESTQNEPKINVFRLAKSFDQPTPRQHHHEQHGASGMRKTFPFHSNPNLDIDDGGLTMNSPVISRVMRGPQQRATFSHQEISSLGPNHPSADRIRNATSTSATPPVPFHSEHEPHSKFPPRTLQYPPLVKSRSGDILSTVPMAKNFTSPIGPAPLPAISDSDSPPPPSIPRQKSFTEFPPPPVPSVHSKPKILPTPVPNTTSGSVLRQPEGFKNLVQSQNVPTSNPVLSNPNLIQSKGPTHFLGQSASQDLKRTSSGSSIFDRARSLYMSSRDAQGVVPPRTPAAQNMQRKKPPSLPRTNTIFPKQYEAQMSPESADKKQREVEAYFKLEATAEKTAEPEPLPPGPSPATTIPARYTKVKGQMDHRIRKSASQGQILNRQKSFSDGEDEDDSVDKIFDSLFKASVESKMAKTSVSGNRTLSEQAEIKATKSASEKKAVEKSASVEASKTATGSTIVKKQSSVSTKSSSYASSTTTSHISTERVVSGPQAIEGSSKVNNKNVTGKSTGGAGTPMLKSSVSSIKDGLLAWCQGRTRGYKNVNITNFSSSWSDGLAFCALIHHFFPDAFDFESLSSENPKKNFDLAFELADKLAGIYPLLETEDMLIMGKNPDYKCIFTYVNAMYLRLKDL